ncbi:HD-GYP domain-containing protein [Pseudothermotoga sp. U03pept]|uniref:HD-GYP domain-containing protein n=1 Tax=Pseudothermotoga sp. U03pept TaxID=3447012 RepID=UPI003EFF12E8
MMSKPVKLYICILFGFYLGFLGFALKGFGQIGSLFLVFLLLGFAFELVGFTISRLSNGVIRLTGGLVANILAATLIPTGQAILISSLTVITSGLLFVRNKDPYKYLFNISQIGLSTGIVSETFKILSTNSAARDMWVVLLVALLYMFLNSFFFTVVLSLSVPQSFGKTFLMTVRVPFIGAFLTLPIVVLGYVLYVYVGLVVIPVIFGAFLAIQLGNLYRSEYQQSKLENLKLLVKSLELKDSYTSGHSERAAQLSYMIAKRLGLPEKMCSRIKTACLLHDVGKIGVPDYILNKPEKLSNAEFEFIKSHSTKSEELLKTVSIFKSKEAKWVRHHHERWDGLGYPDGLKGEEIPLPSRIIAAADIYEALTSARPYREAFGKAQAIEIINEMAGTVLDPQIAQILIQIVTNGQFGV